MTATMTNGNVEVVARQAWIESGGKLTGNDLATRFGGVKGRQWRNRIAKWQEERNGAASAVPAVATNGSREVPLPVRSNGKSARAVTSTNVRRQRVLVALMVAIGAIVAGAVGTLAYSLTASLADAAGTGWHAYVVPAAIDGMYLCGAICLAVDPKYRPAKWAIGIGVVAAMATAWVAAADPAEVVDLELAARTLMAFTPLCLFLCVVFILHAYKVRR